MNDKHDRKIVELIIPMYKDKITTLDLEIASGDLIRCKDCKHRGYDSCPMEPCCRKPDDWFCADGEIR